jgi:hypothetical protein
MHVPGVASRHAFSNIISMQLARFNACEDGHFPEEI